MIYLYHSKGEKLNFVIKNGEKIASPGKDLVNSFWYLSEEYPDELIMWIDDEINTNLSEKIQHIFHHDLIMASYAIKTQFIPDTIGYIDQLPFVNPNYKVQYPTWRMSTDIGGVRGKVALKFKDLLGGISDFGYLLNSMSKIGQQNSLFCYSEPDLVRHSYPDKVKVQFGKTNLFRFVAHHYKPVRLILLFFCFIKYEKKFPIWSLLKAIGQRSWFRKNVDLTDIDVNSSKIFADAKSVDVIIPTMGRPGHVEEVMKNLKDQELLPSKVIIVEQDANQDSLTKLGFLKDNNYPFQIEHHFIHRTGACHARNLAVKYVDAEYIFFADDDIRFSKDLLRNAVEEINRLGVGALNLNCIIPGGKTVFPKIKQWGTFGSGTSMVRTKYALKCEFSELLEHGFGEDIDFGLQLRSKGSDVVYHPKITTIHLKAAEGGFRSVSDKQWSSKDLKPKPSPTMMVLVKKHYSTFMQLGYKVELFLRYYRKQAIKDPIAYIRRMRKRWELSENIADKIIKKSLS